VWENLEDSEDSKVEEDFKIVPKRSNSNSGEATRNARKSSLRPAMLMRTTTAVFKPSKEISLMPLKFGSFVTTAE